MLCVSIEKQFDGSCTGFLCDDDEDDDNDERNLLTSLNWYTQQEKIIHVYVCLHRRKDYGLEFWYRSSKKTFFPVQLN